MYKISTSTFRKWELSSPSPKSSTVQVEGLGFSLWSLLPTTTTTKNFSKSEESVHIWRNSQKILSYIIIPTAHHHHHHRKLFGVFQGSYQNSVKSVPPLIYQAKSKYGLKKRKGRLPSYLGNEGSYQKTVKGVPPIIYHAESNYALKKWKGRLPSYLGNEGSYQKTVMNPKL